MIGLAARGLRGALGPRGAGFPGPSTILLRFGLGPPPKSAGRRTAAAWWPAWWGGAARSMSTGRAFPRKGQKQKEKREKGLSSHERLRQRQTEAPALPKVSAIMKRLYMKVHPDFFRNHPELQEVNDDSFQRLSGFFSTIEKDDTFPPASRQELTFYVRDEQGVSAESVKTVMLTLVTTGGNCKRVVGRTLSEFFEQVGLPTEFEWDDKYWQYNLPEERRKRYTEEDEAEDEMRASVEEKIEEMDGVGGAWDAAGLPPPPPPPPVTRPQPCPRIPDASRHRGGAFHGRE